MNKRQQWLCVTGVTWCASIMVANTAISMWEEYNLSLRHFLDMPIGPVILVGVLSGGALFFGMVGWLGILWSTEESTNDPN